MCWSCFCGIWRTWISGWTWLASALEWCHRHLLDSRRFVDRCWGRVCFVGRSSLLVNQDHRQSISSLISYIKMQRAFLISQLLLVANIPTMALANIFLRWGDDTKSDRIIGGEEVSVFYCAIHYFVHTWYVSCVWAIMVLTSPTLDYFILGDVDWGGGSIPLLGVYARWSGSLLWGEYDCSGCSVDGCVSLQNEWKFTFFTTALIAILIWHEPHTHPLYSCIK